MKELTREEIIAMFIQDELETLSDSSTKAMHELLYNGMKGFKNLTNLQLIDEFYIRQENNPTKYNFDLVITCDELLYAPDTSLPIAKRIENAREDGDLAFWAKMCDHFPEATTGDFDIGMTIDMHQEMENCIGAWVEANTDLLD